MLRRHSVILLLQLVSAFAVQLPSAAFPLSVHSFSNIDDDCLRQMVVAKNNDGFITDEEIPEFIQLLSIANGLPDPQFDVKKKKDLPPQLIIDINNLICSGSINIELCPPGLNVTGATNINTVDEEQQKFLKQVCNKIVSTMRDLLPTPAPTNSPSSVPSSSPSTNPSSLPSSLPTLFPSIAPSANPSSYPSSFPFSEPSLSPSNKPSEERIENAIIPFGLVNMYGLSANDIEENVGGSLNLINSVFSDFAQEVQKQLFKQTIGGGRRNLRISDVRILGVEFKADQFVKGFKDHGCPQLIIEKFKNRSPAPKCQHVEGLLTYSISEETNPFVAEGIIEVRAKEGIQEGVPNNKVPEELRDDYFFYSINGAQVTLIPVAAIAGLTIGAALLTLIAGRMLMRRRIRGKNNSEQYDGLNGPANTMEDDFDSNRDTYSPAYKGLVEDSIYRKDIHDLCLENSVASSSNAGSSGWSSSAGISSLNTGSVDSAEYFGSSLAAIGAASNMAKRYKSSNSDIYPIASDIDESSMSESDVGLSELETDDESNYGNKNRQVAIREELEQAIKDGDWCLVGATAAIIAQTPENFPTNELNSTFSSGLSSSVATSPRKNERSMELDRLVEAGDWEGVVLAAAKFETEGDKDVITEGSASISEGQQFLAARSHAIQSDANSTTSPSVSTNISESLSSNVKRAEIRAEVEGLVRRVVPDEIDNVDEMMLQFKGREEELVETLRTMQERSIAARQREAMRRNAKREARRIAKQNKPPSGRRLNLNRKSMRAKDKSSNNDMSSSFYSANSGDNDCGDSRISSSSKDNSTKNSILTPSRAALDHAIKVGDWEAVGKTAELLGDGSASGTSAYHSADDDSMMSARSSLTHPDADRAAELEGLIDQGDWEAVVAAASKFATADMEDVQKKGVKPIQKIGQNGDSFQQNDDAVSENTETNNKKTRKEEEDALAQAEIWMTIAAQSKKEDSSATKGASDAADWAISRSLKKIQATTNDNHETQSAVSSCDDKSV